MVRLRAEVRVCVKIAYKHDATTYGLLFYNIAY